MALGEGGDGGGVDAAGEERPDRDVGAHVLLDRVLERRGDVAVQTVGVRDGPRGEVGVEVAREPELLARAHREVRARLDPADVRVQRVRLGHVLEGQVVLERGLVDGTGVGGDVEQRLLLAGEERAALVAHREERLDPEPVTRAEQHALLRVPDEEGEHAAQLADDVDAEVVVPGDDGLAVALGLELCAEVPGQPLAQLDVVVDLAVEDQVVAAAEPRQRLVAVLDVDDGQAAEADDDVVVRPRAALVRAPVVHVGEGALDRLAQGRSGAVR